MTTVGTTAGRSPAADESWWRIAALLRIAHHVPGRIRLRLDADAAQPVAGQPVAGTPAGIGAADAIAAFCRAASTIAGIRSARLNLLTRSCVVEYDRDIIPPAAWHDLVTGIRSDAAHRLLRTLADHVAA